MERQRADTITTRGRGRGTGAERDDAALVARYERLLAAIERAAAAKERTGLGDRLGRNQLRRSERS
jgi:hypothetical protein